MKSLAFAMLHQPPARAFALLVVAPLLIALDGPSPWQIAGLGSVSPECVGGVPIAKRPIIASTQYGAAVTALAWSPDGQRLASIAAAGQIDIWSQSGEQTQRIQLGIHTHGALAFTGDGRYLVTSRSGSDRASDSIALDLWDAATGTLVQRIPGPVPGGTWQQNRSELLAISGNGRVAGSLAAEGPGTPVLLYDAETWAPIGTVAQPPPAIPRTFALSPDGERIALGMYSGLVVLFDTRTRAELNAFHAYAGGGNARVVNRLAFSPDGTLLATAPDQNFHQGEPYPALRMIHIWRVADGGIVRTYEGNFGPVSDLSWSPDGRFLASASMDGPVRIWSTQRNGPPCAAIDNAPAKHDSQAWQVAFSPDGTFLAAGGNGGIVFFKLQADR